MKQHKEYALNIAGRAITLICGEHGWGEISPLADYPCDPVLALRAAEEAAHIGWPSPVRDVVSVNALVAEDNFDADALRSFSCVKVKVRHAADIRRVSDVRDAIGPHAALRVDANGAWDVETAVMMINRMAHYDLEIVEQPVALIEDLAKVRRLVDVPLAADECVRDITDACALARLDGADAIVVKVQPLGGVRAALAVVEAAGVPAIVTSMYETSIGLAAGLALAGALPELRYACGFATLDRIGGDVVASPLRAVDGQLRVLARAPEPDPALLSTWAIRDHDVSIQEQCS